MSRDTDRTEALRSELVGAIVEDTGMRETMAMPIANALVAYLQREYAGERLYIPQPARQFDLLQIEASLRSGLTPTAVARDHGTTVRQLHRLFPGGLPKSAAVA
jgi:transcriptional regulator GlxA family with amidase domain